MKLKTLQIIVEHSESLLMVTIDCTQEHHHCPCFVTMTRNQKHQYFLSTLPVQSEIAPPLLAHAMAYAHNILNTASDSFSSILEQSIPSTI